MSHLELVSECEHGEWNVHALEPGIVKKDGSIDRDKVCRGATRRELTLNMVAVIDHLIEEFAITDMVDRDTLLVHAYDMEKAALSGESGDTDE